MSIVEVGECSAASSSQPQSWAKLVSVDPRYPDIDISSDEMVVCSNTLPSSTDKHEWCKITKGSNQSSAMLQNKSSNAILVDGEVVQGEETVIVNFGSEIISGPAREGYLIYKFEIIPIREVSQNRLQNFLQVSIDLEHVKCSICLNVWYDAVTVAPCLHNFCNGCFSEWLRRSQERGVSVVCPQCRGVVHFVGRNHFLRNIVENVLQADSSLKRGNDEIAQLDSYTSIRTNLIIRYGKKRRRPNLTFAGEESGNTGHPCPQCRTDYGGFLCSLNTVHLQCHTCRRLMPYRSGINVPQYCVGCEKAFCGPYWHSLGVTMIDNNPVCNSDSLKQVNERPISRIPHITHGMVHYEQEVTERCIRQMGRSLQDVISDWIGKFNRHEIDLTLLDLNHPETINATSNLCDICYDKLVSFLLYWFRITLPNRHLPRDAAKRADCWYGYACRTQHHNENHARKLNHVCRPTRGL
ncbi:hypothetical protein SAY87_006610 [Trapa incisa]|uniref:RING-type domain-containing protein n=1 Tax=Trapa incisa TaxID=236973 RepID=A0AAN7PZH3_9MYRT|nr:hypothetical protein SAY87_006610 [Trapa incisa]